MCETFIDNWEKCPRSANIASEPVEIRMQVRLYHVKKREINWGLRAAQELATCLLCTVEYLPTTSNLLSEFSLEIYKCSTATELDRREDSNRKYCTAR